MEKNTEDNHHSGELSASINRLCSLATEPRKTVFSDEAQCIIADIEKILSLAFREAKSTGISETKKRKQDQLDNADIAEASRASQRELDLKRMQGLLTSSHCIDVGQRSLSILSSN